MRFAIILSLAILLFPEVSLACGCFPVPTGKRLIEIYPVIFAGKAVSTYPSKTSTPENKISCTTFQVTKIYKGHPEKQIEICHGIHGSSCGRPPFVEGSEGIVFTRKNKIGEYDVGACDPFYQIELMKKNPEINSGGFETIKELESLESKD